MTLIVSSRPTINCATLLYYSSDEPDSSSEVLHEIFVLAMIMNLVYLFLSLIPEVLGKNSLEDEFLALFPLKKTCFEKVTPLSL